MAKHILWAGGWSFDQQELAGVTESLPADCEITCITLPVLSPSPFDPSASVSERFARAVDGKTFDAAVGWSLGAMLILEAALGQQLKTEQLLLIAPCARFTADANFPHGVPRDQLDGLRTQLKQNPRRCIRDFRRACAYPNSTRNTQTTWDEDTLLEGLDYLADFDVRKKLSGLGIPATLIHGDKDAIISPEHSSDLFQQLPNATLKRIPNQGHDLCLRDEFSLAQYLTPSSPAVV